MNKTSKIAVILTIVVLTIPLVLQTAETNAQTHVTNFLYVSVAPKPVGVSAAKDVELLETLML